MSRTSEQVPAVEAQFAFTRSEDLSLDEEQTGILRARTLGPEARVDPRSYDWHGCRVLDCSVTHLTPDLLRQGFAHADLSGRPKLQAVLERVRRAGALQLADVTEIRRHLAGHRLKLRDGHELLLLLIPRNGFFMRRAGPNGMALPRSPGPFGFNDHDSALVVHVDLDIDGNPLRQLLRGTAPWLFRHDGPDYSNHRSPLLLVNLWIPLEQVTRPLALMDESSLDRRAQQLRHRLPTDGFLQRPAGLSDFDIWTFRYDAAQRFCFTSDIDANTAYVFDTLSTPHGSMILPGEAQAEALYVQLTKLVDAIRNRDENAAVHILGERNDSLEKEFSEAQTEPLRRAILAMRSLVAEGRAKAASLCRGEDAVNYCERVETAVHRVVRKSLDMRALALLLPCRHRVQIPSVSLPQMIRCSGGSAEP